MSRTNDSVALSARAPAATSTADGASRNAILARGVREDAARVDGRQEDGWMVPPRFGAGVPRAVKTGCALALGISAFALVGCTAVGTGTRTVIRAPTDDPVAHQFFPGLVAYEGAPTESRVSVFRNNAEPAWACIAPKLRYERFRSLLYVKYGVPDPQTAAMSVEIRDLGRVPALSPELQALAAAEVLKIMMDSKLSDEEKIRRRELLLAQFLNVPRSLLVMTSNRNERGCDLYYYYPHVEIDLSVDVLSPTVEDRFSEVLMLLRLTERDWAAGVRFVDFSPKGADLAEFTRGTLTQQSVAQAKGSYGATASRTANTVLGEGQAGETTSSSFAPTLGGELTYTYTEGLVRELKDSIEKKVVGVMEGGRSFLVNLRAIKHVRIGGTFLFDVMLEVPSRLTRDDGLCTSVPAAGEELPVKADVLTVGVVRHVADVGRAGVLNRVPEPENDDVFEQVVFQSSQEDLWQFAGVPAVESIVTRHKEPAGLEIVMNLKEARYVVLGPDGELVGEGSGYRSKVDVPASMAHSVTLRFLPAFVVGENGKGTTLVAVDPQRVLHLIPGKVHTQIAEYNK